MSLEGQIIPSAEQLRAVPLSDLVNHLVGNTATVIEKPSTRHVSSLVLMVENGDFRFMLGSEAAAMAGVVAVPAASVTDGSGSIVIKEGGVMILPAMTSITAKGFVNAGGGDPALTYYWV